MRDSTYIVIEQIELYERCTIYEPHFMHFGNSITYLSVSYIYFPVGKLGVAHRAPISGSHICALWYLARRKHSMEEKTQPVETDGLQAPICLLPVGLVTLPTKPHFYVFLKWSKY